MWDEDYCPHSEAYDYDPYSPEWDDEELDDEGFIETLEAAETEEPSELDPSEITWRVQIGYSNGEYQDIRCGEEYLPGRVSELYFELRDLFAEDGII